MLTYTFLIISSDRSRRHRKDVPAECMYARPAFGAEPPVDFRAQFAHFRIHLDPLGI